MIDALKAFRETYTLQDAWRHENPIATAFTFTSNTHSMLTLDRIYINCSLTWNIYDWETTDTPVPSDHRMVLTHLVPPRVPFIGKGRWTLPLFLTTNKKVIDQIEALGITLQDRLHDHHTIENADPMLIQRQWSSFKQEVANLAKAAAKSQLAHITNKIKAIKKDITELKQHAELDTPRMLN